MSTKLYAIHTVRDGSKPQPVFVVCNHLVPVIYLGGKPDCLENGGAIDAKQGRTREDPEIAPFCCLDGSGLGGNCNRLKALLALPHAVKLPRGQEPNGTLPVQAITPYAKRSHVPIRRAGRPSRPLESQQGSIPCGPDMVLGVWENSHIHAHGLTTGFIVIGELTVPNEAYSPVSMGNPEPAIGSWHQGRCIAPQRRTRRGFES